MCIRRLMQTTFLDALFVGALRVKTRKSAFFRIYCKLVKGHCRRQEAL